ncbi:glycoside hydrolase family 97 protein [Carboxylicivirga litoralis]|uniref:glycoside hydrolase family 97 protein n=1 Tax=Carboxylicivirga litoralis TaxID=2816963 RepID=UPI0021CAFD0F|nr:glycoside hydrolase family 97 protein [Carboxylicivirga sp. A043]
MKSFFKYLVLIAMAGLMACQRNAHFNVASPDDKIVVTLGEENGRVYYEVFHDSKPVVLQSFLGFTLKATDNLEDNFYLKDVSYAEVNKTWEQQWGEERFVDEVYNEMKVLVEEKSGDKRQFYITFRLFNDGFGFRYEFPEQANLKKFTIMDEQTEFVLNGNHTAWSIPYDIEAYEGLYRQMPISELDTVCSPLTMKTADGLYLAIHEANLTDYAAMNLYPTGDSTLKVYLTPWSSGEKVFMKAPHQTPWRTMIIADNAGDLLLSRLMLNLNEPCQLEDTSWIKPGRYIGIWWGMHMKHYTWHEGPQHGATTENTMRYMDFAAEHGFSGVLVEGWNKGWDDWQHFSFTEPYADFDLKAVTEYGATKGVKLIGHHETGGNVNNYEAQLDDAFNLYHQHGVSVVKTGYVGTLLNGNEMHSGQYAVRHYRHVIEKAARSQIMIDNHEPVMPTGLQRTFPNLMTQEGVRGQEWNAWAGDGGNPPNHTTIIPFTRGLAGPMDFTPGIFNFDNPEMPQTRVQTTLAKQLALSVILYSPLQMAADMIENYQNNPEPFEFIKACPVNWAQTVVPEAEIGEYVTIARKDRDSDNWFVGSITNEHQRELVLPLDFLEPNTRYMAQVFKDAEETDYLSNPYELIEEELEVNAHTVLKIGLAPGGGTAIILTKIE